MSLIRTKDLYQEACRNSSDIHMMTEDERKALQNHLLKIYKEIETVCKKHNLIVMLAYGSVLGAIRHGGFIPWDDDMDLFMPRKDYELLINCFADELPPCLRIYAPNSNNKPIARFAKVVDVKTKFIEAYADDLNDDSQGVFIDIFPLDSLSDNVWRNRFNRYISMMMMYIGSSVGFYEQKSRNYRQLMDYSLSTRFNYWFRYCLGWIFSFMSFHGWMNLIDSFCRNDSSTSYLADLIGGYKWQPIPKEEFLPVVQGTFEGLSVFLPFDSHKHLERTYNDWKKIPKEEDRCQHYIRDFRIPHCI